MNREEMARLLAMHKAAAGALEQALRSEARQEQEKGGGAPTWRLRAATVAARTAHAQAVVTDTQAWLGWLEARHPGSTRMVREPVNPKFANQVREAMAPFPERDQDGRTTGRFLDEDGTVVPGVVFERGGQPLNASITLNAGHMPALVSAAMLAIETGDWTPLWAYSEEGDPDQVLALASDLAARHVTDGNGRDTPDAGDEPVA